MLLKHFYPLEFNAAIFDEFPLSKRFADIKNIVCLCVARWALAPDFRLLNFGFWELGISFKSNMASTKQRAALLKRGSRVKGKGKGSRVRVKGEGKT